jgi:riboflavin synthase
MFTGIVEEVGQLLSVSPDGRGRRLVIQGRRVLEGLKIEDSIAVNGVCLTVIEAEGGRFAVQAVPETLAKTSIGSLRPGSPLNLERAVTPTTRMGGHFVQGHVDCTGTVQAFPREEPGRRLVLAFPPDFGRYLARTGSIAIEGVSLTVAAVSAGRAEIALIPHTLEHTTLGRLQAGDTVNLEFDCLAKYVERLLEAGLVPGQPAPPGNGGLSESRLRELGY